MRIAPVVIAGFLVLGVAGCRGSDHDFNGVVDGLEQHYGISGHRIPMMGLAGFCARIATGGGVSGLRMANFDHIGAGSLDGDDISRVIEAELGGDWRPIVKSREQHGTEQTVIFVRPAGHAMRMLIATYEPGELNVVRVELDGEQLAKWMKDPGDPTHHSHRGHGDRDDETARNDSREAQ